MDKSKLTIGPLTLHIATIGGRLISVTLPKMIPIGLETEHLEAAIKALNEYPIDLSRAPEFTRSVWEHLRTIPFGSAQTYKEVAEALRNPGAARAVGNACAENRLLLVVPCHRVLAEDDMGGFACGLEWKAKLLELEAP